MGEMKPLDLIKFLQMVLDFNIVIDRDYELKSQLGCKFSTKKTYLNFILCCHQHQLVMYYKSNQYINKYQLYMSSGFSKCAITEVIW